MITNAKTTNFNLIVPAQIKMKITQVNEDHLDGNLVQLKNELYEIHFMDNTRTWKVGDEVKIKIQQAVKTFLSLPIQVESNS